MLLAVTAGVWPGASACNVYDTSILNRFTTNEPKTDAGTKPGKDASTPAADAGGTDGGSMMCVPTAEICNKLDDDCNGIVDDPAAAQADCEKRVKHATTTCQRGVCVKISCDPGYYNCDGDPSNGCEPICNCQPCPVDDAGTGSDSGVADAN
ncbi:MAG TPA: hypothetical protein VF331_25975 [Polyangiales bacterium]